MRADDREVSEIVALLLDDDMPPGRLGKLMRAARKRAGMKRRAAARRVGISADALRRYERGEAPVPAAVCARLADAYGDDLAAHVPVRVPVQLHEHWLVTAGAVQPVGGTRPDDVLQAYAALLRRLRGARPGEPLPLRAADLAALSGALGGTPEDVERRIAELLGCSREEASRLRAELVRRKVILPVAGLAAGVAMFAAVQAGASGDGRPAPDTLAPTEATTDGAQDTVRPNDVELAPLAHEAPVPIPIDPAAPAGDETASPAPAPSPHEVADPAPVSPRGELTDATVPPGLRPPDTPPGDDPPVGILPGEDEFIEIGEPLVEP